MKCDYCGSHIAQHPENGLCPNCGAVLPSPPPPAAPQRPATVAVQQPQPVTRTAIVQPGINCCSRCHSTDLLAVKQGFRWGLGLIGMFFIPPFGLLLGFLGRNRMRCTCRRCGYRWKACASGVSSHLV